MDIKDLNKSQLILLTLLVSFIASVATSIITNSLLQIAPTNVTNTINRVIEKTIEQSTPDGSSGKTVQTVIVKEDDLIVDAIARYESAKVNIVSGNDLTSATGDTVSVGFVVGPNKLIVTDGKNIGESKKYIALFGKDGKTQLEFVKKDASGLAIFKASGDSGSAPLPAPLSFAVTKDIKIGQTLVFYSDAESKVLKRIASSFKEYTPVGSATSSNGGVIIPNDAIPSEFTGLPALTLDGQVAGVAIFSTNTDATLVDADALQMILQ